MGYSLTIGELVITNEDDREFKTAESVDHDGAPAFGEPTDHTNQRWPSYSAWANCLRGLGVYDLFYRNGTLIGGHPGVQEITPELYNIFKGRIDDFKARNPCVKPTYDGDIQENQWYCRAVWLGYWMKWALENCKNPVIANC